MYVRRGQRALVPAGSLRAARRNVDVSLATLDPRASLRGPASHTEGADESMCVLIEY